MQKLSPIKVVLLLAGLLVAILGVMMIAASNKTKEVSTIFGEVKVKPEEKRSQRPRLSNYETIKKENGKPDGNRLQYRITVKKVNPFLSLYKEEQKTVVKQEQKTVVKEEKKTEKAPAKKSIPVKQVEQTDTGGFFSIHNTELDQEKRFYKAIFREAQQVQAGKALRIILQESIPALNIDSGTILKGIPSFSGERIKIHITAGIVGKEVKQMDLICFDKEDLIEGVFHDALARQMEEDAKQGLLEEVLDLDFKGSEIARKANNFARNYKNINIDKGREIFVSIPQKEE
jgi:hypothetical protein